MLQSVDVTLMTVYRPMRTSVDGREGSACFANGPLYFYYTSDRPSLGMGLADA